VTVINRVASATRWECVVCGSVWDMVKYYFLPRVVNFKVTTSMWGIIFIQKLISTSWRKPVRLLNWSPKNWAKKILRRNCIKHNLSSNRDRRLKLKWSLCFTSAVEKLYMRHQNIVNLSLLVWWCPINFFSVIAHRLQQWRHDPLNLKTGIVTNSFAKFMECGYVAGSHAMRRIYLKTIGDRPRPGWCFLSRLFRFCLLATFLFKLNKVPTAFETLQESWLLNCLTLGHALHVGNYCGNAWPARWQKIFYRSWCN